jgi:DNA-binding NarL/FixJ family response regulator
MLTTYEEEDVVLQAMCAGAISYISKRSSLQEIIDAVRVVSYGGSYMSPMIARKIFTHFVKPKKVKKAFDLTERQQEILDRIIQGKSYAVIAKELFISVDTVRFHLKKLYKVLHVSNKSEAIAIYLKGNT